MITSSDIDDQRILQCNNTRDAHGHTQTKWYLDTTIPWWPSPCKKCDNLRMLQSEWTKDTPGQPQLKVAVLDATYSWWLSPCIKSNDLPFPKILMIKEFCNLIPKNAKLGQIKPKVIPPLEDKCYLPWRTIPIQKSVDSFQRNWWSKNPAIWLDESGHTQPKVVVWDATLPWWFISLQTNIRYRLVPSRDVDNHRILQSDWLRAFWTTTEEPNFSQTCSFWDYN